MSTGTTTQVGPIVIDNDALEKETRDGFDVVGRLKGRGLRKSTIVLFLNEELGPELGEARDVFAANGAYIGRAREGVLGEIDTLEEQKQNAIEKMRAKTIQAAGLKFMKDNAEVKDALFDPDDVVHPEYETPEIDAQIAELAVKRDEILAELTRTGLTVHMKAVPPVIQKDCRRLAKATLADLDIWKGKGLPEVGTDEREAYDDAQTAHLITKLVQTITDNETGKVNEEVTYSDAIALMGELPESQFSRLDIEMGKLQIKDAISRSIESQEDFS